MMITRAQAEALLTLAESLEACERVGLVILPDETLGLYGPSSMHRALATWDSPFDGKSLRSVVAAYTPKHTGS